MKYSSLLKKLEEDGWFMVRSNKHRTYRHPTKKGQLTVPFHAKEVATGTANRILKNAGLL